MFGSFLPEPWFGFGTTKSTQVAGADIVMKSRAQGNDKAKGSENYASIGIFLNADPDWETYAAC
jgi:hypothetical protein